VLGWDVTVAVLCAAAAHAGWNALIKQGRDPLLETTVMHGSVALPALLAILVIDIPLPGGTARLCLLASAVVHVLYFHAIAGAYRHADLSFAYPVMRGAAPLLTAVATGVFIQEWPQPLGWTGIALISLGVLTIGSTRAQSLTAPARRKALGWALLAAGTIVAYTTIDSIGARHTMNPWSYVIWLAALEGVLLAGVVWMRRGRSLLRYALNSGPVPMAAGVMSMTAYAVALWGMTSAPVASVAALRETSVLFALVIATRLLKEPVGPTRWLGACAIMVGVIALRYA
jgi:drug/metabolite transporter (DMT)-like permease